MQVGLEQAEGIRRLGGDGRGGAAIAHLDVADVVGLADGRLDVGCFGIDRRRGGVRPERRQQGHDESGTAPRADPRAGDVDRGRERAEALIPLCREAEITLWLGGGRILRGWALARQGRVGPGTA